MIGCLTQPQPRVTQHDSQRFRPAIRQIGEEPPITGDPRNDRIDFIKSPALIGPSVAGQRACSQSQDGDLPSGSVQLGAEPLEHTADWTRSRKEGRRFTSEHRVEALLAVQRGPMKETVHVLLGVMRHPNNSKEAPFHMDQSPVHTRRQRARRQYRQRTQGEPHRPASGLHRRKQSQDPKQS